MTQDNVSPLPLKVDLDLDTLERDQSPDEKIEPFRFSIKGRVITMTDPAELDWQDLNEIDNPAEFLRHSCTEEDRKFLLKQKIPGWKFGELMDAFMTHYQLEEKLKQARRQGR